MKNLPFILMILFSIILSGSFNGNQIASKIMVEKAIKNKVSSSFNLKQLLIPDIPFGEEIKKVELKYSGELIGNISFEIYTNKNRYYGSVIVEVEKSFYYAVRDLEKGELIDETDVILVKKLYSSNRQNHQLTDLTKVKSLILKMRVLENTPLYDYQFEVADEVKKGDYVLITAQKGGLIITTTGIAKQNGKKGGYVMVQNIQNSKLLRAKVIDSKKVAVFVGN
ncbi:flagellar basal body P-ring formation protein FlgA [bacterium]|nr:flagellar basal body P-ring formation protein FlgA [bacterium]